MSSSATVTRNLPEETAILAPAIKSATEALLGFTSASSESSTEFFMKAAGKITQEDPPITEVKLWQPAMVQQGLRSTVQILEVLIGPPMGGART
jgi:hypothetical protein